MDIDFEDISNASMMALNTGATSGEAKKAGEHNISPNPTSLAQGHHR